MLCHGSIVRSVYIRCRQCFLIQNSSGPRRHSMIKPMASYLLLSLCVAAALASPIELEARQACPDAYIITARGSNETPGEGTLGAVSQNILSRVPGMSIGVDYIATLDNYEFSQAQGVMVMTDMVKARVNECPEAKIVLMGYSQGAHVVGDTLCGSDSNSPLPAEFGKNSTFIISVSWCLIIDNPRSCCRYSDG